MKIYQYYNFSDNGQYVNFGFLDTLKQVGGGLKSAWDAFHDTMQAPTEAATLAQENANALAEGAAAPETAEDGTVKGPGILKRVGNFFGNMFKKKDVPPEGTNPDTPDYAKPGYQGEKDATLVEAEGMLDTKSPYFDDKRRKGLGGFIDNITGKGPKPDVEGAAKLLQDKAREEAAQEAEAQKAAAEKAAAQKAAAEKAAATRVSAKVNPRVVHEGGASFVLDPITGNRTPITHNFESDAAALKAYNAQATLDKLKRAGIQQRASQVSRANGDAPVSMGAVINGGGTTLNSSTGAPYSAGQIMASLKYRASQLYPNNMQLQNSYINRNMLKYGLA